MRMNTSQSRLIAAVFVAALSALAVSLEARAADRKVLAEAFTAEN